MAAGVRTKETRRLPEYQKQDKFGFVLACLRMFKGPFFYLHPSLTLRCSFCLSLSIPKHLKPFFPAQTTLGHQPSDPLANSDYRHANYQPCFKLLIPGWFSAQPRMKTRDGKGPTWPSSLCLLFCGFGASPASWRLSGASSVGFLMQTTYWQPVILRSPSPITI